MSLFPSNVAPKQEVVEAVSDLDRVLALPRRPVLNCERRGKLYAPEAEALAEHVTAKFSLGARPHCRCRELGYPACITVLNPVQAWTLREISRVGGALGLVPVGGGKTFLGILAALAVQDVKVAALLAKPDQRLHYKQAYLRLREHFRVPSMIFDDGSGGYIVRGVPALHFVPYSRLSRPDATDLLERLDPDLIICDEAHSVSSRTSSRTMRLLRFLAAKEGVRFCAWSGTLIKKSVRDLAHLSAHALGMHSPLPLDPDEVDAWAGVFDPSPMPDRTSHVARKLYAAFDRSVPTIQTAFYDRGDNAAVCRGFRQRLVETPGVISTRETSVAANVAMHEQPVSKMPKLVKEALAKARDGERPDGELLVDAMRVTECAREVACGFYSYWRFRKEDPDELIDEWFRRRKRFMKELRSKLLLGEMHMDSPKLCENAAARFWQKDVPCHWCKGRGGPDCPRGSTLRADHVDLDDDQDSFVYCDGYERRKYSGDLPTWACESWPEWAEIRDRVPHEERTRWIGHDTPEARDPATHPGYFLARDVAAWAREHRGIVWYSSVALGHKIAELAGLPYHGGGADAEAKILAEDGSRSIIASITAHSQGRDGLQHRFHEQLVVEPPASGDAWQQLLGRLCRPGQLEDTIDTWVCQHVREFKGALKSAIRKAEFNADITDSAQLLLCADIDFLVEEDD